MRPKPADDMVQSAIRLPRTLHERLKKAGGDRGMGEEVRRRLEASFAAERSPLDAKARELLNAIAFCAQEITRDFGPLSKEPYAFAVLKETISKLMTRYEPKGELVPNLQPDVSAIEFLFADEPSAPPEKAVGYYLGSWSHRQAEQAEKEKRR